VSSARVRAKARPGGRHLLRSSGLARAIVRDAGVADGDLVVDAGAGSGMLTRPLLAAGARVVAIELDGELAGRLRRACPAATVVEADIRAVQWPREPFRVVANLPFALAAEVCRSLLSDPAVPVISADLIVEWDFAVKRARVWPSTAQGVVWRAWHEVAVVRRVESTAFTPVPPVAAAVLRARRRPEPLVDESACGRYEAFVGRAFAAGFIRTPQRRRARELDAHAFAELFRRQETSASARTVRRMTRRGRPR
jgi:23S rRNA (adenine-N6)-dimethyltransferase